MDELKIGEEKVVWRYSFRPIYKRFVLEKCPIEKIANYADRLPHLTLENLIVYDGT